VAHTKNSLIDNCGGRVPNLRILQFPIPHHLAAVVQTCLTDDPLLRYQDLHTLHKELQVCSRQELGFELPDPPTGEVLPERLYSSAQGLLKLRFHDDAMWISEQLYALDSSSHLRCMTRVLQARIRNEEGNHKQAQIFLSEAETLLDADTDRTLRGAFHTESGRAAEGLGHPDQALSHLEKAVEVMPQASAGWHNLASAYRSAGRIDDAVRLERQAIRISPDLHYYFVLAEMLGAKGDHASALGVIEDAIAKHPHLPEPHLHYVHKAFARIGQMFESTVNFCELLSLLHNARRAIQMARRAGAEEDIVRTCEQSIGRILETITRTVPHSQQHDAEEALRILRKSLEQTEEWDHE